MGGDRAHTVRILGAFAAFFFLLALSTAILAGSLAWTIAFGSAMAMGGTAFALAQYAGGSATERALGTIEPVNFVQVDEGGLRWRLEDRRGYLPFRAIEDVSHAGSIDAPAVLVKTKLGSLHLPTGGMPEDLIIREAVGHETEGPRVRSGSLAKSTPDRDLARRGPLRPRHHG